MRHSEARLCLAVLLISALLVGSVAVVPVASGQGDPPYEVEFVNVVVAIQHLPRGVVFSEAGDFAFWMDGLAMQPWPVPALPPGVITDPQDVVGRTTRTDIYRGMVLREDMLLPDPFAAPEAVAALEALSPPGVRETTMPDTMGDLDPQELVVVSLADLGPVHWPAGLAAGDTVAIAVSYLDPNPVADVPADIPQREAVWVTTRAFVTHVTADSAEVIISLETRAWLVSLMEEGGQITLLLCSPRSEYGVLSPVFNWQVALNAGVITLPDQAEADDGED
ncbi:MAG: hypothetical protein GYB65_05615 [Chloroflexi bacterium]|nr:hypothetical protein [Chloroflexota bacterium]